MVPKFVPGTPSWGAEDSAALRAFLLTATGQRLLLNLTHARPEVSAAERDLRAIQSDTRAGFENAIAHTMFLAEPQPLSEDDIRAHQVSTTQTIQSPAPGR